MIWVSLPRLYSRNFTTHTEMTLYSLAYTLFSLVTDRRRRIEIKQGVHTCHVGETHTHLWLETCDGKTRAAACRLQLQARLCCGDRRSLARFSHTTSHRTARGRARAWTLGLLHMDMRTCMPDARDQASITAAVRVRGYVHHLPTQARARCSRRRAM